MVATQLVSNAQLDKSQAQTSLISVLQLPIHKASLPLS